MAEGGNGSLGLERSWGDPNWPQIAPTLDKKAWRKEHDKLFNEALRRTPAWKRWKNAGEVALDECQTAIVNRVMRRPGPFLDVGCGPGFVTGALLSFKKDVYGCDTSQAAVNYAKEAVGFDGRHRFFRADLEELPGKGKKYDVVICNQVLEHLIDPHEAITMLWDLVADGGQLVIGVPRTGPVNPFHIHQFDEKGLKGLANAIVDHDQGRWPLAIDAIPDSRGYQSWIMVIDKEAIDFKHGLVYGTRAEADQANEINQDGRIKTGMFNWMRLFHGNAFDFRHLDDPEAFDVLHFQLSGTNFHTIGDVRRRLPKDTHTQIVANLDYALEYWYMYPPYPEELINQLSMADHIFSVEPSSANLLSQLLNRPVHLIPHPTDTVAIGQAMQPVEKREGALIHVHRDREEYLPFWMLYGSGLRTSVIGRQGSVMSQGGALVDYPAMIYDVIYDRYLGGEEVVNLAAKSFLCVDSYTHHVSGRTAIETAALGVPTIGYSNVWAQKVCFPETTVNQGDIAGARAIVKKLLEDEEFYLKVANDAREKVNYFGYENARRRFLAMIEGGKEETEDADAGLVLQEETEAV